MKYHSLPPCPPTHNRRSLGPRRQSILSTTASALIGVLLVMPLAGKPLAAQQQRDRTSITLSPQQRAACLEVLKQGLAGDAFWPAMHAAEGLIDGGQPRLAVPMLRARLAKETDDRHRCGLARELVRAGDRRAAGIMLEILGSPTSNGRTHAAESLYKVNEIGDGRQFRRLLEDDSDPRRQLMVAAALTRWGNPAALTLIRRRLERSRSDELIRISAWILARVGDATDIPRLQAARSRSQDALVRAYIDHALALLGDDPGKQRLLENLRSEDGAIRTYAATFAGEVRDPRYHRRLLEMLKDPVLDARIRAAHSLLQMSAPPPLSDRQIVVSDVYPADAASPRWSEGSIAHRADGSLLYATTQFLGSGSDFATARIVARVSRDQGRIWDTLRVLQENVGKRNVMSVTLRYLEDPLRPNAKLGMFYLVKNAKDDLHVFLRISSDDGRSFGPPRQVTSGSGYFVLNNDRVLRLRSGRLLVPTSWTSDVGRVNHFQVRIWYSDDQGATWNESASRLDYPRRGAMEPDVVQLEDGSLLMIVRTQLGHIATSRSQDRGETWTDLQPSAVVSPEAPATVRSIPSTGDLLLIWNNRHEKGAGHGGKRTPLVAAVSRNGGRSWSRPRVLEPDPRHTYAYTSLIFAKGRAVMSYYVRDEATGRIASRFRSVPIAWFYDEDGEE